ncbi:MAG: hypothetical protein RJA99_2998 [Pseudomonadota bacterium]
MGARIWRERPAAAPVAGGRRATVPSGPPGWRRAECPAPVGHPDHDRSGRRLPHADRCVPCMPADAVGAYPDRWGGPPGDLGGGRRPVPFEFGAARKSPMGRFGESVGEGDALRRRCIGRQRGGLPRGVAVRRRSLPRRAAAPWNARSVSREGRRRRERRTGRGGAAWREARAGRPGRRVGPDGPPRERRTPRRRATVRRSRGRPGACVPSGRQPDVVAVRDVRSRRQGGRRRVRRRLDPTARTHQRGRRGRVDRLDHGARVLRPDHGRFAREHPARERDRQRDRRRRPGPHRCSVPGVWGSQQAKGRRPERTRRPPCRVDGRGESIEQRRSHAAVRAIDDTH